MSETLSDIDRAGLEEEVILAALDVVEADTAPPLAGVPSRDQPWTRAKVRLAAAVEAYRGAGLPE